MMIVGGVGYEGFQDEAQLTEALDLPARVAKILKARKAVMYGKEDCIWCVDRVKGGCRVHQWG